MPILSISSAVAYGHVGNAAIQPILNAYGHALWRVDTVLFSNHPGHGAFQGTVRPSLEIGETLAGLRALGGFKQVSAIMTGYLGEAANAEPIADTLEAAKIANPDALYLLDPILGDDGKLYVRDGVPEAMADHLLPLADIVTPNLFELGQLTGQVPTDVDSALSAAEELLVRGPGLVVVTGLKLGEDELGTLAVTDETALLAVGPQHPVKVYGAGDSFSALLMAGFQDGLSLDQALSLATAQAAHLAQSAGRFDPKEIDLMGSLADIAEVEPLPLRDLWAE